MNEGDALAGTLENEAGLLSGSGWEFVRCDKVPFAKRRFLVFTVTGEREVMVFRRPVRAMQLVEAPAKREAELANRIRPRRVRSTGRKAGACPPLVLRPAE